MGGKTSKPTVEIKQIPIQTVSDKDTIEKTIEEANKVERRKELLNAPTQKACQEKAGANVEEHRWCTMEYVPRTAQTGGSMNRYGNCTYIRYKNS